MSRRRRAYYYLGAFVVVTALYTLAYSAGMAIFEDAPRTVTESLLVVVQSFTTTGYGEDAVAWTTPQMRLFAIAMQGTGVFFVFMALPLFVAPWIEEKLTTTVPTSVEEMADHVVICGLTSLTEVLIDELRRNDQPYVVVEPIGIGRLHTTRRGFRSCTAIRSRQSPSLTPRSTTLALSLPTSTMKVTHRSLSPSDRLLHRFEF